MKQKITKIIIGSILAAVPLIYGACGNRPLFDQLSQNSMKVILKGTYESNGPSTPVAAVINDDSIEYVEPSATGYPSKFMLDVAKLSLDGDDFANNRKVYSLDMAASPFFTGTGVEYPVDDITPNKQYSVLKVYIRKMIFNNAYLYDAENPATVKDNEVLFHVKTVNGYDFNQDQTNTIYDVQRKEGIYTNRIFPVRIRITGGLKRTLDEDMVLEVRFVVNNFVKRYEKLVYNDTGLYACHYFALSDFASDVRSGDSGVGGNIITVARVYTPGKTVTMTAASGTVAANAYVAAIPDDEVLTDYSFTNARPNDAFYPRFKMQLNSDIESKMNYLVEYEKCKSDYGYYVNNINDGTFETAWNDFNDKMWEFKIPAIVTRADGSGGFSLTNVPVGKRYQICWAAATASGSLPAAYTSHGYIPSAAATVITQSQSGTVVSYP